MFPCSSMVLEDKWNVFLLGFLWFMFLEAFIFLAWYEGKVVAKVAVCWSSKLRGKIKSNQNVVFHW